MESVKRTKPRQFTVFFFFINDPAPPEIYPLSLHHALPIFKLRAGLARNQVPPETAERIVHDVQSFAVFGFPESHAISFALIAYASCWMKVMRAKEIACDSRSEEHTSELQSQSNLVCRLLLE